MRLFFIAMIISAWLCVPRANAQIVQNGYLTQFTNAVDGNGIDLPFASRCWQSYAGVNAIDPAPDPQIPGHPAPYVPAIAQGWSLPTEGTADVFQQCSQSYNGGLSVPVNQNTGPLAANQLPDLNDGVNGAYLGFSTVVQYSGPPSNGTVYRAFEYLQNELLTTLVRGRSYTLRMRVATRRIGNNDRALQRFGLVLSTAAINLPNNNWELLPITQGEQVVVDVVDLQGHGDFEPQYQGVQQWQDVEVTFTCPLTLNADVTHIIIGNMENDLDDQNTIAINAAVADDLNFLSYTFVDGVELIEEPLHCDCAMIGISVEPDRASENPPGRCCFNIRVTNDVSCDIIGFHIEDGNGGWVKLYDEDQREEIPPGEWVDLGYCIDQTSTTVRRRVKIILSREGYPGMYECEIERWVDLRCPCDCSLMPEVTLIPRPVELGATECCFDIQITNPQDCEGLSVGLITIPSLDRIIDPSQVPPYGGDIPPLGSILIEPDPGLCIPSGTPPTTVSITVEQSTRIWDIQQQQFVYDHCSPLGTDLTLECQAPCCDDIVLESRLSNAPGFGGWCANGCRVVDLWLTTGVPLSCQVSTIMVFRDGVQISTNPATQLVTTGQMKVASVCPDNVPVTYTVVIYNNGIPVCTKTISIAPCPGDDVPDDPGDFYPGGFPKTIYRDGQRARAGTELEQGADRVAVYTVTGEQILEMKLGRGSASLESALARTSMRGPCLIVFFKGQHIVAREMRILIP